MQACALSQLENSEVLDHHALDMAAQHVKFIFVKEVLVGKSILGYLSPLIRVIIMKMVFFDVNPSKPPAAH